MLHTWDTVDLSTRLRSLPREASSPRRAKTAPCGCGTSTVHPKELPFLGHLGAVLSVAFSPGGDLIASAGNDGTVRLWNLNGTSEGTPFLGHLGAIHSVAFSPQGDLIASAGADGSVQLWNLDGTKAAETRVIGVPIGCVAIGPSRTVLAADLTGRIQLMEPRRVWVEPAPWSRLVSLLGLLGCLLFGLVVWRVWKRRVAEREHLIDESLAPVAAFLESDSPLDSFDQADPTLRKLVERLSSFIRNRNTAAPLTFAIAGEWGTGKSSIMRLVRHDLAGHGYPFVWFNAWHHQNETHLFAALMESIRRQAPPTVFSWRGLMFRMRLFDLRYRRALWANSLRVILVSVLLLLFFAVVRNPEVRQAIGARGQIPYDTLAQTALFVLFTAMVVWTLIGSLFRSFGVQPGSLLRTSSGWFLMSRFEDRLSFRHRFGDEFGDVCLALGDRRLVLIIDDLDRCQPKFVPEVLEAVNFLTSSGECFVLLGISPKPVLAALGLSFREMAEELARGHKETRTEEEARPVQRREQDEEKDAYQARTAFAERYMEKLINLRIEVPQFDLSALNQWMSRAESRGMLSRRPATGMRKTVGSVAVAMTLALALVIGLERSSTSPKVELPPAVEGAINNKSGVTLSSPNEQFVGDFERSDSTGIVALRSGGTSSDTDSFPRGRTTNKHGFGEAREDSATMRAGPEGDSIGFWRWVALVGAVAAIALIVSLTSPRFWIALRRLPVDPHVLEDSQSFRSAFAQWAPLVLEHGGSPRAVKRFANRMRYLAAGLEAWEVESSIHPLMLLGALDEVGIIAAEDREALSAAALSERVRLTRLTSVAAFDEAVLRASKLDGRVWEQYWTLSRGVRFSRPGGGHSPP